MNASSPSPLYLDGLEQELYTFFSKPESELRDTIAAQLHSAGCSWPFRYHLSPLRKNILGWYHFNPKGTLLEIGAGMGAVTGLFCDRVAKVEARELTPARAEVIRRRYSDKKNLTVITENIFSGTVQETFDYVTLIGVLEYAGKFFEESTKNPYSDPFDIMLKKAKSFLKPQGTLFIAIENKIGIKYLCGGAEDHYGTAFEGINQYPHYSGIRTFTSAELISRLKLQGFTHVESMLPYPDYKLPVSVVAPEFINDLSSSTHSLARVVDQSAPFNPLFDDTAFSIDCRNQGILDALSHSLLILAKSA